jgi:nucleotide-binding universal stress UspA family protein
MLVTHVGSEIDPHLIRYAAMVARSIKAPSVEPKYSERSSHASLSPVTDGPADVRRQRSHKSVSKILLADSESRFLALLPTNAGRPAFKSVRRIRLSLRAKVDRHFHNSMQIGVAHCDVLRGQTPRRVMNYLSDFDGDIHLLARAGWSSRQLARLALASPCSTWIVPMGWAPVLRRILIPIDLSAQDTQIIQTASHLARQFSPAKCWILHVDQQDTRICDKMISPNRRRQLSAAFDKFVGLAGPTEVEIVPIVVKGQHVARSIARMANEHSVDLIAMSTRGRGRLAGALLPCATAATIREFQGAVLALRQATAVNWRAALLRHLQEAHAPCFS